GANVGNVTGAKGSGGTIEIFPDARLNALFVQASPADIDVIEQLLKVIDKDDSGEDIALNAKPRTIPVDNTNASSVAEIIKTVYANRMEGSGGQQGQQNPQAAFIQALAGGGRGGRGGNGGRGGRGGNAEDELPKMTVGVDERNNALIVAAPDSL